MVLSGTLYIAVYMVQDNEIHVPRILHSSRKWPPE